MEPPSNHAIHVIDQVEAGDSARLIENAAWIASQNRLPEGEVAILLCSNEEIAELNSRFRGKEGPTDVLTFPSDTPGILGDIAIAVPYAQAQAALRDVALEVELAYLAIHGVLHLAGFDDIEEADRVEMLLEMNRCAVAAGLPEEPEWASLLHYEATA